MAWPVCATRLTTPSPVPNGRRGGWLAWPAVGAVECLAYGLAPGAPAPAVLTSLTSLTCVILALFTIRRRRPADTGLRYVLTGGLAMWAAGDLISLGHTVLLGHLPFPSWVDACYRVAGQCFAL